MAQKSFTYVQGGDEKFVVGKKLFSKSILLLKVTDNNSLLFS